MLRVTLGHMGVWATPTNPISQREAGGGLGERSPGLLQARNRAKAGLWGGEEVPGFLMVSGGGGRVAQWGVLGAECSGL